MKKKGLIISTIVMVLVLAASLTTATYAWFSSTAAVQVQELNITTTSSAGLQIAVSSTDTTNNPSNYANGDLSWDGTTFTGTDGFGSILNFAAIDLGSMDHAVTRYSSALSTKYTGKTFPENPTDGDFLKASGYDANVNPTGFEGAAANVDYLDIPIFLTPTASLYAIYCTISLTVDLNDVPAAFNPGMAAASRIEITTDEGTATFEPFASATLATTAMNDYLAAENTYKFVLVVSNGDDPLITAGELFECHLTIWIEGEDGACKQVTAGSGFDINVNFTHSADKTDYTTKTTAGGDYVTLSTTDLTTTKSAA